MTTNLDQSIDHFKEELSTLRTNRATPLLVEKVLVEVYGSALPLIQVATIIAPDATSLLIQPFDKQNIKLIEEAISGSDLGLNPTNEGEQLRISIPPLTEERRNELIKLVKQNAELARVSIRQQRDELMKAIRAREKANELSEDERFAEEKTTQQEIDNAIEKINTLAADKEGELNII